MMKHLFWLPVTAITLGWNFDPSNQLSWLPQTWAGICKTGNRSWSMDCTVQFCIKIPTHMWLAGIPRSTTTGCLASLPNCCIGLVDFQYSVGWLRAQRCWRLPSSSKLPATDRAVLGCSCRCFVLMPLIANRTEVRPELMRHGFSVAQSLADRPFSLNKLSWKWLFVSPGSLMQLVWVNTHIFFYFGIGIPIVLASAVQKVNNKVAEPHHTTHTGIVPQSSRVVGLLEPLTIFHGYEYQVVENQSLRFMVRRFGRPIYW